MDQNKNFQQQLNLSGEEINSLKYLKSCKKTKDDSIYLSHDFNLLIFKPKEEHDDPSPELPIRIFDFVKLYAKAKEISENFKPTKLFVPKNIFLYILSTEIGTIKEYVLKLDNIECKINNKESGKIPFWLLHGIKASPWLPATFDPPQIKNGFVFSIIYTIERLTDTDMVFTYQEAFINENLVVQFDWMTGDVLIPSINSASRGYRFYISHPELLKAFEALCKLTKYQVVIPQVLNQI